MFIQRLEGNWFSHPFWRRRFVLSEAGDLEALRTSQVPAVIIDESRGKRLEPELRTVAKPPQAPATVPLHRTAPRLAPVAGRAPRTTIEAPLAIAREFGAARAIADRSRRHISQAFLRARLGKGVAVGDVEPVVEEIYGSLQRNSYALNERARRPEADGRAGIGVEPELRKRRKPDPARGSHDGARAAFRPAGRSRRSSSARCPAREPPGWRCCRFRTLPASNAGAGRRH
ncbi:DUF3391 domain-containing protein [Leptolyngbya sp. 15MV]|nr:DUF3391 domain-containing protein [Leptolyngbya sp. 15MV]